MMKFSQMAMLGALASAVKIEDRSAQVSLGADLSIPINLSMGEASFDYACECDLDDEQLLLEDLGIEDQLIEAILDQQEERAAEEEILPVGDETLE